MTALQLAGTVLGFDFGTRRIGVAVGNTITRNAVPLTTIEIADDRARIGSIATLVGEWSPTQLVVGIPVHADGAEHAMTARAREFVRMLERRFGLPVAMVDERYTTEIAQQLLDTSSLPRARHRSVRDQVAAQVILQSWFDDPRPA
ncbi:MAG TPA: Holliday junction resolvase RuvX [Casimicrobiaceae bacterium]